MQPSQWQAKGTNDWEVCSICWKPLSDDKRNKDYLCFLNCKSRYSQLSSSTTMSLNSRPTFVYRRRRQHMNSVTKSSTKPFANTEPNDRSCSSISSESPTPSSLQGIVSLTQTATEAAKYGTVHTVGHNTGNAGSFEGCFAVVRTSSMEALRSNGCEVSNVPCANDNCSSSKSIVELNSASLKTDLDDAGESSSSGKLITENIPDEMSERDKCISILRSLGFLDRVSTRKEEVASKMNGVMNINYCSKPCKVCKRLESTAKMLICDNCEDAFHVSCSNPPITSIPVGEWLCGSCLKKKRKLLRGKASGNSSNALGSLHHMFTDREPYMSNVRVGDEFQASVPYWSGPSNDECELIGDLLELHFANHIHKQERISTKPLKLSGTGNWLQCREVITGTGKDVDGSICGKWRRAPLFEVQSDDWECFDSVRWDPVHADCAVPQELDTEEVMKQLKLVEAHAVQLKPVQSPQPVAKRRKSDSSKSNGS